MSEQSTEIFSIVKLLKNNKVEYPITRPECVVYTDGTTLYQEMENAKDLYYSWRVYKNNLNETDVMFNDINIYHEYYSATVNTVRRKYHAIAINGSMASFYPWGKMKDDTEYEGAYCSVIEDNDSEGVRFTMKHFVSLMGGYAPDMIISDGVVYDIFVSMKEDVYVEDDKRYACLKLVMTRENQNEYNGYKDQIELAFIPTYIDPDTQGVISVVIATNPLIIEFNR